MFTPRRKHLAAGIALFAFLHAAATPLFAALRMPSQPEYFGALCTMGGVREAPAGPAAPAPGGVSDQPPCVFCIGGAWQPPQEVSLALPFRAVPGLPAHAAYADVQHFFSAALQPLSPRAPPRLA